MKRFSILGLAALATLAIVLAPRTGRADDYDKKTIITLDQPTEVPGIVLEPGRYVLKLLNSSSNRHIAEIMNRLVDAGNTVIVIEHNTSVIKNADWIIDMGPEGGTKGGKAMFEGTPKQLLTAKNSLTSQYLQN